MQLVYVLRIVHVKESSRVMGEMLLQITSEVTHQSSCIVLCVILITSEIKHRAWNCFRLLQINVTTDKYHVSHHTCRMRVLSDNIRDCERHILEEHRRDLPSGILKQFKIVSSGKAHSAVRVLLPGYQAKHAVSESTKAATKYTSRSSKQSGGCLHFRLLGRAHTNAEPCQRYSCPSSSSHVPHTPNTDLLT